MFEGTANPQASAAMQVPVEVTTLRKNIENFRSVLYSAAQHLKTVQLEENRRAAAQVTCLTVHVTAAIARPPW